MIMNMMTKFCNIQRPSMVMGDFCKSLSYELLNEQESLDLSESRPLVLQGMQVFGQSIFCKK